MAKVILMCGKICAGKTSYAKKLMQKNSCILLSSDELISSLFHPNENEYHDKVINAVHEYLKKKSVEIINAGASVVLDWGFWTAKRRKDISNFYRENGIEFEWHYIDVDNESWHRNIYTRNNAVLKKQTTDYYVDSGLLQKCNSKFEVPKRTEIDVWYIVK